jgi:hypothetical protein
MKWKNGTLQTPNLRVQVTNSHIYAKGIWVMHVREFGWNCREIGISNNATEQEAQIAAVDKVKQHLKTMLSELDSLSV